MQKLLSAATSRYFKCFVAIAIGGLLTSCSTDYNLRSQATEVKEEINFEQYPFAAVQKILELSQDSALEEDASQKQALNPVSFRELLEYLPQSPRGWEEEKPKGQTTSFGEYSISQVEQSYFNADKQMTVSIFDWAFNSALYAPFLLSTEFSQESTEGYNKGIKIGDFPGRENYDYNTSKGSLNLLINRRFFVRIDGKNIDSQELRDWWEKLDYESLDRVSNF